MMMIIIIIIINTLFHSNLSTVNIGQWITKNLFLSAFVKLRKASVSFVMSFSLSVRSFGHLSAWNSSAPTGRVLMKF